MRIISATKSDTDELLSLYHSNIGGAAGWDEHYPSLETIEFDLSRDSLFILKDENGRIAAAISIDLDEEVEKLTCWNREAGEMAELARLCVREDMRNKGIARQMMEFCFERLRIRGKKTVHILVRKEHKIAFNSYAHLNFVNVGNTIYAGHDYVCMERIL